MSIRNGMPACELPEVTWRKSRRSGPQGGNCVEVAHLPDIAYLEHLTSALYFDKKPDVDRYLLAMERLSIVSTKPGETPEILTTLIHRLED